MYQVGTATEVRAFHIMPGVQGPEGVLHAHDYKLEVLVEREELGDERLDHAPLLVDEDHAVGVSVERDPEVRLVAEHGLRHRLRVDRAAAVVDVLAVGIHAERDHLRPQLLEDVRRDVVRGAVRTVHHHGQPVERELLREDRLQEHDVPADGVVDPRGLPDARGGGA